jgi:hypothetical protein
MSPKNYLPQAYALLLEWLITFTNYLTVNLERFGIPEARLNALQTLMNLFHVAQAKAGLPNAGKADRLDRKEKAQAVSKAARSFVNANLRYNEAVTDEDRVNMGLTVPDTHPTPVPPPDTMPAVYVIDSSVIMRLKLHFKDSHRTSRAKPYGVRGVEILWSILAAPPTTMGELIHSEFSTRSPYTFIFDENQRGKTVWFRLRWENTRGEKGPWSELYSAIIP